MRSSINSVRSSFIATIKELGYAVYDRYRKVNDYPYIIVGGITEVQNGAQDRFGQIVTVNIEVYDGWKSDYGIMNRGERIVDAILRKILNNPHTHEIPGFNMPVLTLDNMIRPLAEEVVDLFRHVVEEIQGASDLERIFVSHSHSHPTN